MTQPTLPPFVQDLLDRGLDPLDDARTREWLLEHPAALESFAALRASLGSLGERATATPAPSASRRWLPGAAAAAALVLVTSAIAIGFWPPSPAAAPPSLPRPDFAATGKVVHCRVASTMRDGTRGRQDLVTYRRAPTGHRATLAPREHRSLRTFAILPGPSTPWSRACVTEERVLRP